MLNMNNPALSYTFRALRPVISCEKSPTPKLHASSLKNINILLLGFSQDNKGKERKLGVRLDTIQHLCNAVSRQVRDRFRNLTIHFIVHQQGQLAEALGMAGQEIMNHPAAEAALHLLTETRHVDESALIGTAVMRQNLFGGLASRNAYLALCSISSDRYEDLKEARRHAFHLSWHAIDVLLHHSELPSYTGDIQDIIQRRRNTLEITAANLQADVFAAVMSSLHGDREAVQAIARQRGKNILSITSSHKPELYPFTLADDTTLAAMKQLNRVPVQKKRQIDIALALSRQVGLTFDENDLAEWLAFAVPAQDLAWCGTKGRDILGSAINASANAYVRANAYHVSEVTGVEPASILELDNSYNPYAEDDFNRSIHEKMIDDIFKDTITRGLEYGSAEAFSQMANEQNIRLLEGHMIGWCASALQTAGLAFGQALAEGGDPAEAAHSRFLQDRDKTPWESLRDLSENVISKQRDGEHLMLDNLEKMTADSKRLARLNQSIKVTLSDAEYRREYGTDHPANGRPPVAKPERQPDRIVAE